MPEDAEAMSQKAKEPDVSRIATRRNVGRLLWAALSANRGIFGACDPRLRPVIFMHFDRAISSRDRRAIDKVLADMAGGITCSYNGGGQ
jgi:hypothetical protein